MDPATEAITATLKTHFESAPPTTQLLRDFVPFLNVFRGDQRGVGLALDGWLPPQSVAKDLFAYLHDNGPWVQASNVLFGKPVAQPRLKFHVGEPYNFSGRLHSEADRAEDAPGRAPFENVKSVVELLMRAVEPIAGHPINNAMVQLYRDGEDCIGAHSDDETVMRYDPVERPGAVPATLVAPPSDTMPSVTRPHWTREPCRVLILSLGAPREMEFTASASADWAREFPLCVEVPKPKATAFGTVHVGQIPTHDAAGGKLGDAARRLTTIELVSGQLVAFMGDQSLTMHAIHRLSKTRRALRPDMNRPRISISMRWFYRPEDPRPPLAPRTKPNVVGAPTQQKSLVKQKVGMLPLKQARKSQTAVTVIVSDNDEDNDETIIHTVDE